MNSRIIEPLSAVGMSDIDRVGGKCASLGEMTRNLGSLGIRIPEGFVITTDAYYQFMQQSGLEPMVQKMLAQVDTGNVESLRRTGLSIRQAISVKLIWQTP